MPFRRTSVDRAHGGTVPVGSLTAFFSVTYALSWTCFATAIVLTDGLGARVPALSDVRTSLGLLGTFGPAVAAIVLTVRADGAEGLRVLLGRLFATRAAVRWYLFAVGYMAAIRVSAAVAHRLIFGSWPPFGPDPWGVIALSIVISTPFQAGEEIGWRGYALPRLAARFGLARASLLLGPIWACWHLPLFFLAGNHNYGQSFPMFALGAIALSVAIAWLYSNTEGSLLLVMLMHSAINQSVGIVPATVLSPGNLLTLRTSPVQWLSVAFLWATAVYFLVRMRRADRRRSQQISVASR